MSRKIGYARVSTIEQSTEAQVEALYNAGCELVFSENVSGAKKDRVRLREAIAHVGQGDQLVVVKIDRLARSLTDLLQIVSMLVNNGGHFASLSDPIDTSSAQGTLMLQILGSFAEFERALVSERTKLGLQKARKAGRVGGNPKLKSRDTKAIALVSAQRKQSYFDELNSSAHVWVPIVRKYRPRYPWNVVAGIVNGGDGNRTWTGERLRRAAKCFVKDGLLNANVLARSARTSLEPTKATMQIAGMLSIQPSLTLKEIAEKLDRSKLMPPRSLGGWSQSSVRSEILKAIEIGLIEGWKQ